MRNSSQVPSPPWPRSTNPPVASETRAIVRKNPFSSTNSHASGSISDTWPGLFRLRREVSFLLKGTLREKPEATCANCPILQAEESDGIRDIEVELFFFQPVPEKRVQLVPLDVTSAKCVGVFVVDGENGSGRMEQISQRTLSFGDSADATQGIGELRFRRGGLEFAFHCEDGESIDVAAPHGSSFQHGFILLKSFINGQKLLDGRTKEFSDS